MYQKVDRPCQQSDFRHVFWKKLNWRLIFRQIFVASERDNKGKVETNFQQVTGLEPDRRTITQAALLTLS